MDRPGDLGAGSTFATLTVASMALVGRSLALAMFAPVHAAEDPAACDPRGDDGVNRRAGGTDP